MKRSGLLLLVAMGTAWVGFAVAEEQTSTTTSEEATTTTQPTESESKTSKDATTQPTTQPKVDPRVQAIKKRLSDAYAKCQTFTWKTMTKVSYYVDDKVVEKTMQRAVYVKKTKKDGKDVVLAKIENAEWPKDKKNELVKDTTYVGPAETYVLVEAYGNKIARKVDTNYGMLFIPSTILESIASDFVLTVLDDRAVNQKPVNVIKVTLAADGGKKVGGMYQLFYVSKTEPVLVRSELFDDKGRLVATINTTETAYDTALNDKMFEFVTPEGVVVEDMRIPKTPISKPASEPKKK